MIENVSTQLTVFHCFAHCLLPGRAFASLYVLLFLEKEAEIGGRVSYFLEIIGRTAQVRWLICAFVVCMQKSFSRNWVKKLSCKFKYTRTVNERPFRPFFSYLKASNCCGVSGTIRLTLDIHLHLHSLCVCEHLCPWQECEDVQARLSLLWLHVREEP